MKKLTSKVLLYLSLLLIIFLFTFSLNFKKNEESVQKIVDSNEDNNIKSNIIKEIKYLSKDLKGNEYEILAEEGEIDYDNTDVIFLKKVKAFIRLRKNNEVINITSDYGKYNTASYDTIFSKNVRINYIDNKIEGDNLDFSMINNLLIISKDVVYSNSENILYADIIKMNTISNDIEILMHNSNDKVLIKNLN